eukprot:XP_011671302.1 PREDICTED: xylosyltransferase oxt-like [Strongylocentrotus purpuratus]
MPTSQTQRHKTPQGVSLTTNTLKQMQITLVRFRRHPMSTNRIRTHPTQASRTSTTNGDYIGCFPQGCLHFDYIINISESITPDSCTATCKEHGFPYVAIRNRTKCACSCEQTCMNNELDDKSCGLPCRGDLTIFCGGYDGASIYAGLPKA